MAPDLSEGVLALDVGGTKVAAAFIRPDARVVDRQQFATGDMRDGEALLHGCVAALRAAAAGRHVTAVAVGAGGPMAWPEGRVSPLNLPLWRDFPLRQRLAEEFSVPVRLHNDAIAMTAGEHWAGAGRGHDDVLGMVVSTGIGGGLVLGGQVVNGRTGNAGHIGHVVVEPDGPTCACGGRGCLEAVASGPSMVRLACEAGWPRERASGAVALAAYERTVRALGRALASAVSLLDLSLVVIGGGLAQAADLIEPALARAYHDHAGLDYARAPRLRWAQLGQDAGLVGAGALWLAGDRYWRSD
jgi:glucokinase